MSDPKCKDCKYFRQHYIQRENQFFWAGCGHCVYPRLKHRKPNVLACVYFERTESGRKEDADLLNF